MYTQQTAMNFLHKTFVMEAIPKNMESNGRCAYEPLTPNHKGCALGCLLSPELRDNLSNNSIIGLSPTEQQAVLVETGLDIPFLNAIQQWHDTANGYRTFTHPVTALESLCIRFGLVYPGDLEPCALTPL